MTTPTGPEADATAVQDPPSERARNEGLIAQAIQDAEADAAKAADPEAQAANGTGPPAEPAPAATSEPAPEPKPEPDPATTEPPAEPEVPAWVGAAEGIDWSDAEARQAFVSELLDTQQTEMASQTERRLSDQRTNLTTGIREQSERTKERETLLGELDELAESDPAAYTEKLNGDPVAAGAILDRAAANNQNPLTVARGQIALEQARRLMIDVPWIHERMTALDEAGELQARLDPSAGGMLKFLAEEAAERGVTEYKASATFQTDIEAAARRAVHDAVPGAGGGSPPPSDGATPAGRVKTEVDTGDILKDAVAKAAAEHGVEVDLDQVRAPTLPGQRTGRKRANE